MESPIQPAHCVWRMVGVVTKLLMPTCEGAPSRNAAKAFENAPYCESAGPFTDIVAPGPKKDAPFAPNILLHIASVNPSERMRRMSTPNLKLCMEVCRLQFHTQLNVLSIPRIGT